jgi:hypothetical protein
MQIKYFILTLLTILLSFTCSAQEVIDYADFFKPKEYPKSLLYMKVGYENTQINGSEINTEMAGIYSPTRWVDVYGGFHVASRNLYQIGARGDFKWWVGENRNLALRNQYSYSAYANENLQNFNMSLLLVYDQEHLYASFGGYAQFFTNFFLKDGVQRTYIWEPGLAYDFQTRIFKKSHIWNLGLQITNIRHLLVERSYAPNFIFNGNYRICGEGNDHLNLLLEAGFQPSGIFHIVANYYSFFFNVGITCNI